MTWIPCPGCHQVRCCCQPIPLPQWQTWTGTTLTGHCQCCRCAPKAKPEAPLASFSEAGHTLTDEDIERVARRVVELLGEKLK